MHSWEETIKQREPAAKPIVMENVLQNLMKGELLFLKKKKEILSLIQ